MADALQKNLEQFNRELSKEAKKLTEDQVVLFIKKVALEALRRVVMKTPVNAQTGKGGRARGNWQVTLNAPATGQLNVTDKSGTTTITKGFEQLGSLNSLIASGNFPVVWITNNVDYIEVLEFGLYPGSGPNTIGGFSKQAPKGMVQVTLGELREMFK